MKFPALLAVSLPLLAMSQLPVSAEPTALAQQGSWLKASLSSLKTDPSAPNYTVATARPAARKVSHAMPTGSTPAFSGIKMRPFMPNRPLPHESDLQRALVAQQAQMDNTMAMATPTSLSGEVNYMAPRMVSSYSQYSASVAAAPMQRPLRLKKQVGTRSPRLMPGQTPVMPEQLSPNQPAVQPMIPDPPTQPMTANRPQFPISMPVSMMPQTQQIQQPQWQQQLQSQWQQQQPLQQYAGNAGYQQTMQPMMQPMQQPMQQYTGYQQTMQPMMQPVQQPMQQPMQQSMQWQQMPMQQCPGYQQTMQPMMQQPMQQMPMQGYSFSGLPPAGTMQQRPFIQSMQPMASPAFEMPHLTQQEQLALEKLVAQNRPTAVMDLNGDISGVTQDNPSNGAGPGPFPMNLLPGNAMHSLNRSHQKANVPQARFGSWHCDSALPECGFHTWLGHRQPHLFSYKVTPPTGRQTPARRAASTSQSRNSGLSRSKAGTPSRTAMASPSNKVTALQPKAKPVVVASYPSYTSARGMTY